MPRLFGQADFTPLNLFPAIGKENCQESENKKKTYTSPPPTFSLLTSPPPSTPPPHHLPVFLPTCVVRVLYLHKIINHHWISARF